MQHVVEDNMSKCRTKSVKDAKCIIVRYPPVNCVPLAPAILIVKHGVIATNLNDYQGPRTMALCWEM